MEQKKFEYEHIDINEILNALMKKILVLILCGIIGAGVMAAYSIYFVTPVYQSTVKIYVLSSSTSITSIADIQLSSTLQPDFQEMITCRPVINQVKKNLGLEESYGQIAGMVSIYNPPGTHIINISVSYHDPEKAAEIANELANVSKEWISKTMKTDAPSVFEKAVASTYPVEPNKTKNIALGFLIGFLIPCIVITFKVVNNTALRSDDKIERLLGYAVLAHVPNEKSEHVNPEKA